MHAICMTNASQTDNKESNHNSDDSPKPVNLPKIVNKNFHESNAHFFWIQIKLKSRVEIQKVNKLLMRFPYRTYSVFLFTTLVPIHWLNFILSAD